MCKYYGQTCVPPQLISQPQQRERTGEMRTDANSSTFLNSTFWNPMYISCHSIPGTSEKINHTGEGEERRVSIILRSGKKKKKYAHRGKTLAQKSNMTQESDIASYDRLIGQGPVLRSREPEVELMNYLRNIIRNNSIFRNIIRISSI